MERALSLIPAAAFAALVANDLIQPDLYAASSAAILPVALSSVAVLVVARKSGSLLWCAVTGMAAYALLGMVFSCYLDDFSRICRSLTHVGHMH